MSGYWDHKTKPSMFVVTDEGKEVFKGTFKEGHKMITEQHKPLLSAAEQKIEQQFGKIIKKFPILHHGWDGDGYGYVVANIVKDMKTENFEGTLITPKLILTNHSKPYEADSNELRLKINEYQNMIGETNEALKLLDGLSGCCY